MRTDRLPLLLCCHRAPLPQDFARLSDTDWAGVDVLLSCGVGKTAAKREVLEVSHCKSTDCQRQMLIFRPRLPQ